MIAVNQGIGPIIMLASGANLDLLDPWSSRFTIDDIAHGLAHTCRYAGQCSAFYSVAEHSLHVADVIAEFELEALLHDGAEAFIGDVTRPLKQLLPEYKRIEAEVEAAIFARFGMLRGMPPEVKRADLEVLAAEQMQMMPPGTACWATAAGIKPARIRVEFLSPGQAKQRFLDRFAEVKRTTRASREPVYACS